MTILESMVTNQMAVTHGLAWSSHWICLSSILRCDSAAFWIHEFKSKPEIPSTKRFAARNRVVGGTGPAFPAGSLDVSP